MEIRDTRNGDWHWVYNAVLADSHITDADKVVYSAISTFGGHQVIHPTLLQIGERCNISERQVRYSLRKLEEVGYLSIEASTGRGNSNVYYLLKAPKGCKLCPFYKGGKEGHERGQTTTIKGARTAPHIDIYKDKINSETPFRVEKVTEKEERPKADTKYLDVYRLWGDFPLNWKNNKTELNAAKNLLVETDLSEMKKALALYEKHKSHPYCPTILKPSDLDRKWDNLLTFNKKNG